VWKWVLIALSVAALGTAAGTGGSWLPPLLTSLRVHPDRVQAVTGLVQLGIGVLDLIIAVIALLVAIRSHREWQANRDQVVAGRDVQTGGQRIEGSVGGDAAGGDISYGDKVKGDKYQAQTINITPGPPGAGTATALHQLPSPPRDFTGRQAELQELIVQLETRGVTISGLAGMGGIGKTALALVLADRLKQDYPDAQFYLDLKGTSDQPVTAADAMAHVIRACHPDAKLPESEDELAGLYRSCLDGKRALVLMDNAASAEQVKPLLPPAGCVLMVTSRQRFTLPGLVRKDLDVLPAGDARDLLLKIASRIGDRADEIADLCGRLPLALRAAASLLNVTPDLDPEDYAQKLRDERGRLKGIGKEGVDLDVAASFGLSYERLPAEAACVFRRLAVFPGSFDAAAEERVCEDEGHAHLSELVRRSLVEWDKATGRYRLHDLMRLFADERLEDAERAAAQRRHAEHYKAVLAAADDRFLEGGGAILRGLALFDLERSNIEAGQAWAAGHAGKDDSAARLCSAYPDAGAYVLDLRQHPRERIGWLESALAAARRLKDRQAEGNRLGNLGIAYHQLGEPRRAIEYHEQQLTIAREIGDRRGEGNALGNLGLAYADLGEPRRAIEYYEQCLTIDREIGDRRGEGNDLGNLGLAYADLGEPRRSIEFYEQHLTIAREVGDRQGEAGALGNLGNAYLRFGDARRAVNYYEQALAIHREIGDRRGEGNDLGNLGLAYADLGAPRRAIEFYEQALAIDREIGDRRGEGNDLWNMAVALDRLGEPEQAIANAEAALAIYEQIEDPAAEKVREQLARWRGEA